MLCGRRRTAEKEAAAFAVHTNKAGFERDAADLTLYQRGPFSEHFRIRLVRQRPRIAGTEQRRGNAQLDPIGGGVPAYGRRRSSEAPASARS
jgi:hypothetical protein